MPSTRTLISPPACVNSMIRRRTRAIQSMFSTPLSMEIFAPADNANHSNGICSRGEFQRGVDAAAFGLGKRAEFLAGISEKRHPRHALGVLGCEVTNHPD